MSRVSLLFLFFLPTVAIGQAVTSDDFFQQTLAAMHQAEILTLDPVKFPWIEEIDLRTETREFDLDQQEITLRLSPSTPRLRKAQSAMEQHYASIPDEEGADLYGDYLLNLYGDWLSLYFLDKQISILDSLEDILSDRQQILERQVGVLEVDLDELVDLEIDINDLKQKEFELEGEQRQLLNRYELKKESIRYDDLISLEQMNFQLQGVSLRSSAVQSDPKLDWEKAGIEKEINLERAERRKVFDFLQLRYRGPSEDVFREKYAIGLGFTFDNSGSRRLKLSRLMYEKRLLDTETQVDAEKMTSRVNAMMEEFQRALEEVEHFFNLKIEERKHLEELSTLIRSQMGFDPLLVLKINEHNLQEELKSLEYMEDLYFDYLEILVANGLISQLPFKNHLKA